MPVSLGAILVVAGILRIYDISANPPGFFADEASFGYNAYSVLHTGKDEHGQIAVFFEAFGEYKLPVYIYSLIPFIFTFGLTELAVRLTTAVYGVATVLVVYLLVRELFRHEALAVTAAAVLAILPWHVHYSRTGLGDITVHLFFLVLGLYFFILGTRRPAYWVFSTLAFVLALFSYRAAWVLVPLLLAVLALLYYREIRKHWQIALASCVPLALAATAILAHLLLTDNDRATQQWIFSLDLGTGETIVRFFRQYFSHFNPTFLFDEERQNLRHVVPGSGWLYWWQVPFIFLGALALMVRPSRPKMLVLALLVLFPLASALSAGSPDTNRTLIGSVAFSIITAFGLITATRILINRDWGPTNRSTGVVLAGALLLATAAVATFQLASYLDVYHGSYQRNSAGFWGWQWGARQIVEHFRAVEDDYDLLVIDGYAAFNEPQIFLKFYAPNDCGNCVVGQWDEAHWPNEYDPAKKQLFAIHPARLDSAVPYRIKGTLYYPNNEIAFFFAEIASDGLD